MATVSYIQEHNQSAAAMKAVIDYCQQEKKVYDMNTNRRLVSGVNCDGENAYKEFMATKKAYAYREELTALRKDIWAKMEQTEKNIQEIQEKMQASIEQAGKNQESFLNNTLQKGSELEQALAAQVKKVGILYAVKWIAISILSSAASTLLLHLWLK